MGERERIEKKEENVTKKKKKRKQKTKKEILAINENEFVWA